jgi:hypothetical protein
MNMGELYTIGSLALPIKILLLNNRSDGMVRNLEDVAYGKRHSAKSKIKIKKARASQIMGKGKNASGWKRGSYKESGYVQIYSPDHPFCNHKGYVREHRLVVEKYLGRYLKSSEHCHHINGIRNDNRLDNLMVFISNTSHRRWHNNPNLVNPEEIVFDGVILSALHPENKIR